MNGELVPAAVAATGGVALASGIYVHEKRRDEAMRASRERLALRFPIGVKPDAATAALAGLVGLPPELELVAEVAATRDGVVHALHVPKQARGAVGASLGAAIPGLRMTQADGPTERVTVAVRLFLPTPSTLLSGGDEIASRALLHQVTGLAEGEHVVLRWALRAAAPRLWFPREDDEAARRLDRAWRRKTALGGFRVAGLVLVRADGVRRARQLADDVLGALRSRSSLGKELRATSERGNRGLASVPKTTRTSGWLNTDECLALLAWPLGDEMVAGVTVGAAREVAAQRALARTGRRLFVGRDRDGERPVALSPESARHHLAVIGPSGTGKSVLLARSILDDLAAGYGGAVIDPKADLVATVLDRVPDRDADRVVVLDPSRPGPVPGVAVLGVGDPDLRSDVLLGALRAIFGSETWGIRSEVYGRLGLRTLAEVPGATLADLGRLFLEPGFRRQAVGRLTDPLLLGQWQAFENLSASEQANHVQAPMTRVMSLVGRPALRRVLAQPRPQLDIEELFAERKFLLVSLAPGTLGEPGARLLGTVVLYVIWSAIEARIALAPNQRHPIFLYIDELATIAALPFGLELLAERARGLGAGLTVATQTLGRLPETTRSALLGNAASLVTFRAGADEANRIARELPGLSAADLQALGRFEVAARVATGSGSAGVVVTGRTEPLPPREGQAQRIRRQSAERYGGEPETPAAQMEADVDEPVGRTRRAS